MIKNDYLDFENQFRGSRDSIVQRLSQYEGVLSILADKYTRPRALDIGCGRGEWLEKCRQYDFQSTGIDSDQSMVAFSKQLGLNIIDGDFNSILKSFDNGSLELITLFHVIEHLTNFEINQLILQCKRLLSNDGLLLFETPSIDNLQVSTRTFFLDPTHINQINPDQITYLVRKLGFFSSNYFYINSANKNRQFENNLNTIYKDVAQDILVISCLSAQIKNELDLKNSIWYSKLDIGISTSEAIFNFDKNFENTKLKQKDLYLKLESRINYLEKRAFFIFKLIDKIRYSYIFKIFRKIFINITNMFRRMNNLIKYFIRFLIKLNIRLLYRKILSFLDYKKTKKIKNSDKYKVNNRYISYFYRSPSAKTIYNNLISKKKMNK